LGIALLWIVLYHLPINWGPLQYPRAIGYGGVDICFFASGIGCFYSLSSDSNVFAFMKRRTKRLVPTYLIFIAMWLFYQYVCGNLDCQMAIGNIFALQYLAGKGNYFNWYITAIFLFYLLAPYFKAIAEQKNTVHKIAFLTFLLMCSIPFWNTAYIVMITRFPIFYLGMLFANMCKKDTIIDKKKIITLAISFIFGLGSLLLVFLFAYQYLWSYGLYWYPFILITPPLCLAISYICMILEKSKATTKIVGFFSLCGDYSFELYLVHMLMFAIIPSVISWFNNSTIGYAVWVIGLACIPIGCYFLRCLSTLLIRITNSTHPAKQ
jgi:peptidoglycan/LPS O-acetylase OafA/YrhL